jgi:hypothetical protein
MYPPSSDQLILARAVTRAKWRVVPFLILMYVAGWFYPGIAARTGLRRTFGAISLLGIGFGLVVSGHASPLISIIALCFVTMGIMTAQPIFWTFPTSYLSGTAAAGGFALINSVGAIGGFVAPNLRTGAETFFHSPIAGIYAIAAAAFLAILLFVLVPGLINPCTYSSPGRG